jgi:Winged helix-turn helix
VAVHHYLAPATVEVPLTHNFLRDLLVSVTLACLVRQHGGMRPTAYRRNARGLRDCQAFEQIRMQAGALFAAGRSQAEVAHQLGVARQNVSRWHARWQAGGLEALRSAGPTGQAPRLSDAQLAVIDQALRHRLHYRRQRPARRAVERDEQAIARWVAEDWP